MAPDTPPTMLYRSECEQHRNCLKNDLKELITQERNDRRDGEMEMSRSIEKVDGKMDSLNTRINQVLFAVALELGLLIVVYIMGKI